MSYFPIKEAILVVNWCSSSKNFALLSAYLPKIKLLASIVLTISSASLKADSDPLKFRFLQPV